MNRSLYGAAFLLGAAAVVWVGAGYVGSNALALTITLAIGAVYALGALELFRFRQATTTLSQALAALAEPPADLGEWLAHLPASLQPAVRLRVEGERAALPGPLLTPYLVGLLVMLGMLGTFLGMVVTLNGAVLALQGTTDLPAMRAALAAPVHGLGLAFGTSVAGVAASAMLGLISALCRRERLHAAQLLDHRLATSLRRFSRAQQRQDALQAAQVQAQALPALVAQIEALMAQMAAQQRTLSETLAAGQDRFHREAAAAYGDLASTVGASLQASLRDSARLAGETIEPAVAAAMAGIAGQTTALQAQVATAVEAQLAGVSARLTTAVEDAGATWRAAQDHEATRREAAAARLDAALAGFAEEFERRAAALLTAVDARQQHAEAAHEVRDAARLSAQAQALDGLADRLQTAWVAAGDQALTQQQALARTFAETAQSVTAQAREQARQTIDEVARLMQTAAEAPRAAAEVIGQLRQELSASQVRDNALLDERSRIMATLAGLLEAINHAAVEQRSAIDTLLAASAEVLDRVGGEFAASVARHTVTLGDTAAELRGSAIEVASLSEALAGAVGAFGEANGALVQSLQAIEQALEKAQVRSDDQLAYTVAQARELIDLSVLSQQRIIDDLQRRFGAAPAPDGGARG